MSSQVTHVWFRSKMPLGKIARQLGLQEVTQDAEDYWAWAIGWLGDVQLDITRTHTRPADQVDTAIFVLGADGFSEALLAELTDRLRRFFPGTICCGRWEYRSGNDFDLVVIRELEPINRPRAN